MTECVALTKDMLKNPIRIQVDDKSLDFARAKQLADELERERLEREQAQEPPPEKPSEPVKPAPQGVGGM